MEKQLKQIRRFMSEGNRLQIGLGLLCVLFVLWIQLSPPFFLVQTLQRLEYLVYDQRMRIMPKADKPVENRIVIVDLDERSLQAEGQYPWNRFLMGQLTEKLREYGALVVGFDITFPEPDRSVRDMLEPVGMENFDPEFLATLERLEPQIDSDRFFASAMQSGIDAVLAINFNNTSDAAYNDLPLSIVTIDESQARRISASSASGYTGNIGVLQEAAQGSGSMNQQPDSDGIVRRVPLVIRYGNDFYPTLSLEMLRVYNFAENYEVLTDNLGGADVIRGIRVGSGMGAFVIPTDSRGQVLVPYVGTSSLRTNEHFPYVSATDVLRDTLSADESEALQNSLVLVGTSAPGLLDLRAMPLQQVYPGVEVHANMLNALLSSVVTIEAGGATNTAEAFSDFRAPEEVFFPYKPVSEPGTIALLILLLGAFMSFVYPRLGAPAIAAVAFSLLVLLVWGNFQLWSIYKMDFSIVMLIFLVLLVTGANMIYGYLAESQTRKTIKGMFDQYVPPAHIDSMLADPDNYSFDGESKEITVLFSDIRSFTTISEALSATQLKKLLNDFFTPITEIIFDQQGTIDKYVGDMVMVFWGAPLDDPDHRKNAIKAALQMLEKVEELKPVFEEQGFPEVNVGVGINTGVMNVGDMGSTYRRSYTVLGDAVNLGSRLEGLTKFYGIRLLVGEETVDGLDGFLLRHIDRVKVKGKDEAIDCFEPICESKDADSKLKRRVDQYHQALDKYFAQDWNSAEEKLQMLLLEEPECLLYKVYLERISILREQTLPEDWDGSFTHTSK